MFKDCLKCITIFLNVPHCSHPHDFWGVFGCRCSFSDFLKERIVRTNLPAQLRQVDDSHLFRWSRWNVWLDLRGFAQLYQISLGLDLEAKTSFGGIVVDFSCLVFLTCLFKFHPCLGCLKEMSHHIFQLAYKNHQSDMVLANFPFMTGTRWTRMARKFCQVAIVSWVCCWSSLPHLTQHWSEKRFLDFTHLHLQLQALETTLYNRTSIEKWWCFRVEIKLHRYEVGLSLDVQCSLAFWISFDASGSILVNEICCNEFPSK